MTGGVILNDDVGGLAGHVPVLLEEAIAFLEPVAGGSFIDGTFGGGGYSRALLAQGARVLAIDRDGEALAAGRALAEAAGGRLVLREGRFSQLAEIAAEAGFAEVDGVVFDIGVSSRQLDDAERGFSFAKDGPLDMRMGRSGPTAADIVNTLEEGDLAQVIAELGEERRARFVARRIVEQRRERPFERTRELADLVERVVRRRPTDPIHPATRTFQAIRIFLNRELEELARGLAAAERVLKAGGRLVAVTFHSLEDRIVKRFLADRSGPPAVSRHQPPSAAAAPTFRLLTKGAVAAGDAEVAANPRSRSAKLRAAERTQAAARPLDMGALSVPQLPQFLPAGGTA